MTAGHVIVLHGLALNRWWMMGVARQLKKSGYAVHNISYPSCHKSFEEIVRDHVAPLVAEIPAEKVHFVVHSMGGLLIRLYAERHGQGKIGRVVMLGTPNHGSEVADFLKPWAIYRRYFGSAGQDLGTASTDLPARLPPVAFECGVIAGRNCWFHVPTSLVAGVPFPNDGIVSVESTKVAGMKDHVSFWVDHSLMVWSPAVWRSTVRFLGSGNFSGESRNQR